MYSYQEAQDEQKRMVSFRDKHYYKSKPAAKKKQEEDEDDNKDNGFQPSHPCKIP